MIAEHGYQSLECCSKQGREAAATSNFLRETDYAMQRYWPVQQHRHLFHDGVRKGLSGSYAC